MQNTLHETDNCAPIALREGYRDRQTSPGGDTVPNSGGTQREEIRWQSLSTGDHSSRRSAATRRCRGRGQRGRAAAVGTAGAVTNARAATASRPLSRSRRHLVFGVDAEEQGFNPSTSKFDEVGVMYARTVFDPLTIITRTVGGRPTWHSRHLQCRVHELDHHLAPQRRVPRRHPCDGAAMLLNFEAQAKAFITGLAWGPVLDNFQQTGPLSSWST